MRFFEFSNEYFDVFEWLEFGEHLKQLLMNRFLFDLNTQMDCQPWHLIEMKLMQLYLDEYIYPSL